MFNVQYQWRDKRRERKEKDSESRARLPNDLLFLLLSAILEARKSEI